MNRPANDSTALQDKANVAIIGGGPSGAFFAINLLNMAKKTGRKIFVSIIEKKGLSQPDNTPCLIKGCNYCAGIVSPRLHDVLLKNNIRLPRSLIYQEFTHIWFHSFWKNFPLRIPRGQRMYSVFRGTLPPGRAGFPGGFDNFLLQKALELGAEMITGQAIKIEYNLIKKPVITIKKHSGEIFCLEPDFTALCTGINADNNLFKSYKKINPFFTRPEKRRTLVFELQLGSDYLEKYMDKEIYFVKSGSKDLQLEYCTLVPKGDWLTIALSGKGIDRAVLPRDKEKIIKTFLSLPSIKTILPHACSENIGVSCSCTPFMAVKPAKNPIAHRIAVTGDALGARLYRDGLYSAFTCSQVLAHTVINKGTDTKTLSLAFGPVVKWLEKDNFYANIVFKIMNIAFSSRILSRILYQSFATEMKFKQSEKWHLGNLLLWIGIGSVSYYKAVQKLISPPVIRSILRGFFKTARNIVTEIFFNIKWEEYGRYPTVIIKEKRDYFKKSIAKPLGIKLDHFPEMERMYAIKIRASAETIFNELGKFGDSKGKFLRLRFMDVIRTSGHANQEGSVVSYCSKILPISMKIRLKRCIPNKSLLYEPEELFAVNGKLLFDIRPTKDGNNRLVIYTGFDFRKGEGFFSGIFWKNFKKLFPGYAHDVVWNHAICCIKAEAEK